MAKNLDGIKKLSPDEVEKYRKIVLNYIGEGEEASAKKPKSARGSAIFTKKVDGLNTKNLAGLAKEAAANPKKEFRAGSGEVAVKRISEKNEESKKAVEPAGWKEQEKKRLEEAKARENKMKIEENEKNEKLRIKENLRLEKIKREQARIKIKQEIQAVKQAAREKKKIERQKESKKYKKKLKLKIKKFLLALRNDGPFILLFTIFFIAIAYLVLCLIILRWKIDNKIFDRIAYYVPVPAAITNQGIINYIDFKKAGNGAYLNLNLSEKKTYLAKWKILNNLKKKYGDSLGLTNRELAIKFASDNNFNQVGLSRIIKILALLKSNIAIEQLAKYADEYNEVFYFDNEAVEKFGPAILELSVGQASNIIIRPEGYYIAERLDAENNRLAVKHIFIKAISLNQYMANRLGKIKIFILAN